MKLRVVIEKDDKLGGFSATCPELNFVSSCGETVDEAVRNLEEAINLYLEPIPEQFLTFCTSKVEYRELVV